MKSEKNDKIVFLTCAGDGKSQIYENDGYDFAAIGERIFSMGMKKD